MILKPSFLAKVGFYDSGQYEQTFVKLHDLSQLEPRLKVIPCHCSASHACYHAAIHL